MRKTLALIVLALAIPGAALAASTTSNAAPKVMYVLNGTLSNYTAASSTTNGSVTIHVTHSNYHGRLLAGKDLTFAITTKTTVTLNGNATITNNSRGVVKFRALKNMTNTGLLAALKPDHMRAFQVIDQGR